MCWAEKHLPDTSHTNPIGSRHSKVRNVFSSLLGGRGLNTFLLPSYPPGLRLPIFLLMVSNQFVKANEMVR